MSTPFLPSTLPLLPLPPPQVLFPFLTVSISLPSSHISLILEAISSDIKSQKIDEGGSRILAVVPVVEIERRVGRWATAARIKRIVRTPDHDDHFTLTLEGLARIRLPRSLPPVLSILPPIPLPISSFSLPLPTLYGTSAPDLLPFAKKLLPSQLHSRLELVPVGLLADLLAVVLGLSWETRVEILGTPDVETRTEKIRELMIGLLANRGLTIPSTNDSDPSEQGVKRLPVASGGSKLSPSKALIRRPPPGGISAAGGNPSSNPPIPEDLQPLLQLREKRSQELTKSAMKTFDREFTRLIKIPPQSAEYGVTRTYLEWILALPWKKVSVIPLVHLDVAKKKLEEEHEGLGEVKRRVVEYLAVYRLKRSLFEEKVAIEAKAIDKRGVSSQVEGGVGGEGMDKATEEELMELIPADDRKDAETPLGKEKEEEDDDGPPKNVFRDKGPILLLVGPPGVGKTSIARSLATSMGRKFHRISLGGVRDEAEIRGHRRTYVGALPGLFVQAMRKVGVSNPLILLDELDKIGTSNFHGDPSAALLETLDPAQNWSFHDHYLGGDLAIDLSQVMFIATANSLDTISPPLLDRCEVIQCSGYVMDEKVRIATRFLLPRQIEENGLKEDQVIIGEESIQKVIGDYTREAGVRSLEREIGKLCRNKAVEYSTSRDDISKSTKYDPSVTSEDVERILGVAKFDSELCEDSHRPGVITGLAYRGSGMGGILLIETTLVPGGKGRLILTGSLGDVIKESAELGLTWVKSHALELGIIGNGNEDPLRGCDLHLHLPSGAVKKDGPSAGVAMTLAIISLLTGRSVPSTIAFTGEITLRGAVTAVGGIKEKVLGAHRAGITRVILPTRNYKDVHADLPESTKSQMEIEFVSNIEEAIELVWGKDFWCTSKGRSSVAGKVDARL